MILNQGGSHTAFYEYAAHVGLLEIRIYEGRWNYTKVPILRYCLDCRNDPLVDFNTDRPTDAEAFINRMMLDLQ